MKRLLFLFIATAFYPMLSWAGQTLTTVSCDSATVGKQVVSSIGGGVVVTVPSNAAVAVWLARTEGTCSTTMVSISGVRVTAGNGFQFNANDDGYFGGICCLLESGITAVTVYINTY